MKLAAVFASILQECCALLAETAGFLARVEDPAPAEEGFWDEGRTSTELGDPFGTRPSLNPRRTGTAICLIKKNPKRIKINKNPFLTLNKEDDTH